MTTFLTQDPMLAQVDCIHWVSAPQLALLEVALSRMERVHAWVLMMGGGGSVNVFEVPLFPPINQLS